MAPGARIDVENCILRGTGRGIYNYGSRGGFVRNTLFDGLGDNYSDGISVFDPSEEFIIEDCHFQGIGTGLFIDGEGESVHVRHCTMENGQTGCGFQLGASGSITDCDFRGFTSRSIIVASGPITITDNVIDMESGAGMYLICSDPATIRRNSISTDTGMCLEVAGATDELDFKNNHMFRSGTLGAVPGGFFAMTHDYWPYETMRVDLSGNYWGTINIEEIETYIVDGEDLPNVNIYVDFLPLADGTVATENTTLGGLKARYR